jgi:hypothetical protein
MTIRHVTTGEKSPPHYEGDIKINNKLEYDLKLYNPKLYNKGESNTGIIPLVILLKHNKGRPYKYLNIIVFL